MKLFSKNAVALAAIVLAATPVAANSGSAAALSIAQDVAETTDEGGTSTATIAGVGFAFAALIVGFAVSDGDDNDGGNVGPPTSP